MSRVVLKRRLVEQPKVSRRECSGSLRIFTRDSRMLHAS